MLCNRVALVGDECKFILLLNGIREIRNFFTHLFENILKAYCMVCDIAVISVTIINLKFELNNFEIMLFLTVVPL